MVSENRTPPIVYPRGVEHQYLTHSLSLGCNPTQSSLGACLVLEGWYRVIIVQQYGPSQCAHEVKYKCSRRLEGMGTVERWSHSYQAHTQSCIQNSFLSIHLKAFKCTRTIISYNVHVESAYRSKCGACDISNRASYNSSFAPHIYT